MVRVIAKVDKNLLDDLANAMPGAIERAVRKQVMVTERDVKLGIVKWNAIDTGNMLGSVRGEPRGREGEVSVNAESENGYPYPAAVNYGHVRSDGGVVAPRPFFSEAEEKARKEWPQRVRDEIEAGG